MGIPMLRHRNCWRFARLKSLRLPTLQVAWLRSQHVQTPGWVKIGPNKNGWLVAKKRKHLQKTHMVYSVFTFTHMFWESRGFEFWSWRHCPLWDVGGGLSAGPSHRSTKWNSFCSAAIATLWKIWKENWTALESGFQLMQQQPILSRRLPPIPISSDWRMEINDYGHPRFAVRFILEIPSKSFQQRFSDNVSNSHGAKYLFDVYWSY